MLILQLKQLQDLLEQQQEERDSRVIVQLLERRNQDLEKLASEWQGIVELATAMQLKSFDIHGLFETRDFCNRPEWTSISLNDKQEAENLSRQLRSRAKRQRKIQEEHWQTLKKQRPTSVSRTRAVFLMSVGNTDIKNQLLRLNQNIHRIVDQEELPTPQQFQQWSAWIDDMEQIVATHLPNMTPRIETFFNKLTSGDATMDDLTDEVVSWCRVNNLTHRITLKFSDGG